MKRKKKTHYVVWQGRCTGIFTSWDQCKRQVQGFEGAKFKGFFNEEAANKAFEGGKSDVWSRELEEIIQMISEKFSQEQIEFLKDSL